MSGDRALLGGLLALGGVAVIVFAVNGQLASFMTGFSTGARS